MNYELNEKVKLKFKQSVENKQSGYTKYNGKDGNGTEATILNLYNDYSKEQACRTHLDDATHYFNI